MKKSGIYLTASMAVICLFSVNSVLAGRIEVMNENKKELKVKIQAEGSATEKLAEYTQHIPAGTKYSFTVDRGQLKGKSYYSIKGHTNPFTPGGNCEHLSVDKDYKVTFQNDTIGTTCLAEEITNS